MIVARKKENVKVVQHQLIAVRPTVTNVVKVRGTATTMMTVLTAWFVAQTIAVQDSHQKHMIVVKHKQVKHVQLVQHMKTAVGAKNVPKVRGIVMKIQNVPKAWFVVLAIVVQDSHLIMIVARKKVKHVKLVQHLKTAVGAKNVPKVREIVMKIQNVPKAWFVVLTIVVKDSHPIMIVARKKTWII